MASANSMATARVATTIYETGDRRSIVVATLAVAMSLAAILIVLDVEANSACTSAHRLYQPPAMSCAVWAAWRPVSPPLRVTLCLRFRLLNRGRLALRCRRLRWRPCPGWRVLFRY